MAPLAGHRGLLRAAVALSLLLASAAAALQQMCAAPNEFRSCAGGAEGSTSGASPVQRRAAGRSGAAASVLRRLAASAGAETPFYRGTGCAERLGGGPSHPAACVVVKDSTALLVDVPYGESPGWDLPGGWHHEGEAPCETAEREVCEETGMSVRAVRQLSDSVFQCEVTGTHVCTKPVDEGFLQYRYFSREQLSGLKFRGFSWGDKEFLLRKALEGSSLPHGTKDACGCRSGIDGWSTTARRCFVTSRTSTMEAIECQRRSRSADFDACGCRKGLQGWSTTSGRCLSTSRTSPSEEAECGRMTVQHAADED